MVLYSLYKKHHWLVAGPTFYQLHLLFDKHAEEQNELVDQLAERVQSLGGIAVGDPRHAAELTTIERPPNGAEEVAAMIHRLLDAHETIIEKVRKAIKKTEESEDWGSNDLLMGDMLRTNELQVWFVVVARRGRAARQRLTAQVRDAAAEPGPIRGARGPAASGSPSHCAQADAVARAARSASLAATRRAASVTDDGLDRPCQPSGLDRREPDDLGVGPRRTGRA